MKYSIVFGFIFFFFGITLKGQEIIESKEGSISFITTQNVYVKFQSTTNIAVGDTLFVMQGTTKIPALKVNVLSSISCVCTQITMVPLAVGDKLMTNQKAGGVEISKPQSPVISGQQVVQKLDTIPLKESSQKALKQQISGRISVSSYSNLSNVSDNTFRMRYTLSLNAQNIGNSKFSNETYVSFAHKNNEWSDIQDNIYNGLKIYSLAVNYAFNRHHSIWVGRKINSKISNVGAIDGIQYESGFKWMSVGAFAGSRPDYLDYSFNASLLQFGAYISHDYAAKTGNMQSSLALVEQLNSGHTDRRFTYVQHSNSLIRGLYFFGSAEFDLYNKTMNTADSTLTQDNSPKLSNLYALVRYRVMKQLSVSLSYSNRENVVYYETYKNIIDQLLDVTKMQGYVFHVNYSPIKKVSLGGNAGYRFSKNDPKPTKNVYSYVTYSNVPWIDASATLSATFMQTSYLNGQIYSLGLSRDLIPGKLYGGLSYRFVDYEFVSDETPLVQNMAELNLTWRILKKLSCSFYFEGTFEKEANFESLYFSITQRF